MWRGLGRTQAIPFRSTATSRPRRRPEALIEPDPYASVPMLWQLPSVIRTKLPKLSMSVHVYAPEAPGRFVIVDRKKYREGDVLKGGVRLEAIVADGIVLDYQGQRYRLGN
jgi:general secretion pathway protein B